MEKIRPFTKNKTYQISKLAVLLFAAAMFGINAETHKYFYLFFLLLFSYFFFQLLLSSFVRFVIRGTSFWLVRDDIPLASERAIKLHQFTFQITYFNGWFTAPLVFWAFNAWLVQRTGLSAVGMVMAFFIAFVDFICRLSALNWEWKNLNSFWPFSMKRQVLVILEYLVFCPFALYFIYLNDLQPDVGGIDGWAWPVGGALFFVWYIGLIILARFTENLFLASYFPRDLFYYYEEMTHGK